MIECPICKRINLDNEESCECGYNFKTNIGGKRVAAKIIDIAKWATGLGVLGFIAGFIGGGEYCKFSHPGITELDACAVSAILMALLGVILGVIAGTVVAIKRSAIR